MKIAQIIDRNGRSLLHYCCEYGQLECVEYLISLLEREEPDADSLTLSKENMNNFLNLQDSEGFTAMLIAVLNGNLPILRLLIDKGANFNLYDREQHTAVHWATGRCSRSRQS